MQTKDIEKYLEAAMWADCMVKNHADWPTDVLVVLRRLTFHVFLEGYEYAKNHPQEPDL